jgi:DNA-directed RNA polymerase subunit RPC12/RpoP
MPTMMDYVCHGCGKEFIMRKSEHCRIHKSKQKVSADYERIESQIR